MSAYLLDTHALVWLVSAPERIPVAARDLLANPGATILVSAVTAWEIATKHRLGKMPEAEQLIQNWSGVMADLVATETPLTTRQGFMAGSLDWQHKDPFDRMLVAQAIDLGVPLVSGDGVMPTAPGLDLLWR